MSYNYGFKRLNHYDQYLNIMDDTEILLMEKCYNLYLNRFVYKNLPPEMEKVLGNRNYIDAMLFNNPSVAFFKDKKLGVQVLPTTGSYKFNLVGRPIEWYVKGFNGYSKQVSEDDSVIMFNDEAMTVPFLHIYYEIKYMKELDKTALQNIKAQRQPFIIETEEETLKSAQAQALQLDEFKPIIFKRKFDKKHGEPIETKVFQTGVDFKVKDYMDVYNEFFNRILTYLGINNINVQDKKERLITSEASANDMLIQSYFTSAFDQRKIAIEKVNKMFGTNIVVEKADLKSMVTAIQNEYSAGIVQAENKGVLQNKEDNKEDNKDV